MSGRGAVEQAIAALRTGRAVAIGEVAFLSVEAGTPATLDLIDPGHCAPMLLSGERAAALGVGNTRDGSDPSAPVLVSRCDWLDRDAALALADPALDLARGPIGPLKPEPLHHAEESQAALALARLAGLLPALWLVDCAGSAQVTVDQLVNSIRRPTAHIVARANLPLDGLPPTQIIVFRNASSGEEHVALLAGASGGRPPLVRLHSECLTGDVFGSLKCDCGPQLREALRLLADAGGGILLYLRQEGRGIGLANKIRAYQLQDRGLDTVDANRRLGFADDERDFAMAGAMLRALGADRVRLLTNNPRKLEGLRAAGVEVVERVAHHLPTNPHNADYVATKKARSGHLD